MRSLYADALVSYIDILKNIKVITYSRIEPHLTSFTSIFDIMAIHYFKEDFCCLLDQSQIENEDKEDKSQSHLKYFKKINSVPLWDTTFERSQEILEFVQKNSLIANSFIFEGNNQQQLEYFTNPEFYKDSWWIEYTFNKMHEISRYFFN